MFKITPKKAMTAFFLFVVTTILAACGGGGGGSSSSTSATGATNLSVAATTQSIRHVFVITLENENYATTFGASSKAPYLSQTLTKQGAQLTQYYGTGHVSLDNYIAMISGQPATNQTASDCQVYQDFAQTGTTADGLPEGSGCVFPAAVKTLPDQLAAAGYTWKGYMGDMGNDPTRESVTCGHPTLNTQDKTQIAEAPSTAVPLGDQYATRHNPFMYFHSIIDGAGCAQNVVNLNALQQDLKAVSTTANLTFITPSLCDDGHDSPCVDGRPGGLVSADAFLQKWVPIITASPAYKQDGLLIINFDESSYASITVNPTTHAYSIAFTGTACCNQQPGPNLSQRPITEALAPGYSITYGNFGGDNTGAVLLSQFIKPGTVSSTPYNHYSLLKSIEDIFQLGYLGYAGQSGLVSFGSDIYTAPASHN